MTAALFEADLAAVLGIADDRTRDATLAMLAKHLSGKHDQSSHGRGGGGLTGQAALDAVPASYHALPEGHFGHTEELGEFTGPAGMGSAQALAEYEGVEFWETNETLRGHFRDPEPGDVQSQQFDAERKARVSARVADIDKTMAVSRTQEDIIVERGVTKGRAVFGEAWHRGVVDYNGTDEEIDAGLDRFKAGERPNLTGTRWTDKAYQSASADGRVADAFVSRQAKFTQETGSFGTEGEPVVMRMAVPKGTGAVQLGKMGEMTARGPSASAEIMLERGLTMEVTADHGIDALGIRRLDVAVVPGG